jgi:hypothetical protein
MKRLSEKHPGRKLDEIAQASFMTYASGYSIQVSFSAK